MEAALKIFFSSSRFAVAGASSDSKKYGYKLFQWYLAHRLPVTPVNPRVPSIAVNGRPFETAASPAALPHPADTSLSIVTPPPATLGLLRAARDAGVPAVWMQPGAYDDACLAFARAPGAFQAVIAGTDAGADGVASDGDEGWCVLVDGERGLDAVGKL